MKKTLTVLPLLLLLSSLSAFAAGLDCFGVTELCPTMKGGREWFAGWKQERVVPSYEMDPADSLFYNEEGDLVIREGTASIRGGMTRLVVLTPTNQAGIYVGPLWTNVEMTIYVRRGKTTRTMDYQALYLSARSGAHHNDTVPCEGTSYHATARFDGQCGFKKEIWHTGGYTKLCPDPTPKPWPTVPEGKWLGMKFICRNCDTNTHVRLQLYLDTEESNQWKLVSEFTDAGGWLGEKPGCDRPQDYIITEGRAAVYFRSDYVAMELKKFSVREVSPLP